MSIAFFLSSTTEKIDTDYPVVVFTDDESRGHEFIKSRRGTLIVGPKQSSIGMAFYASKDDQSVVWTDIFLSREDINYLIGSIGKVKIMMGQFPNLGVSTKLIVGDSSSIKRLHELSNGQDENIGLTLRDNPDLADVYFGEDGDQIINYARGRRHQQIYLDNLTYCRINCMVKHQFWGKVGSKIYEDISLIDLSPRQRLGFLIDAYLIFYYFDIDRARKINEIFIDQALSDRDFRHLAMRRKDEIRGYFDFLEQTRGELTAIFHYLPMTEIKNMSVINTVHIFGDFDDSPLMFKVTSPRFLPRRLFEPNKYKHFY